MFLQSCFLASGLQSSSSVFSKKSELTVLFRIGAYISLALDKTRTSSIIQRSYAVVATCALPVYHGQRVYYVYDKQLYYNHS